MGSGRDKPPRGSGPRGAQRRPTPRPISRPGHRPSSGRPRAAAPVIAPRAKLTGRFAVLILVVSVLVVSYASSMRAYLQQKDELRRLDAQIAQSQADIAGLRRDSKRYQDPAYIEQQARDKFGFVMRGEIGYTVLDSNGQPLDNTDKLADGATTARQAAPEWYQEAWDSVLLAGNPPKATAKPQPVEKIAPPSPKPSP